MRANGWHRPWVFMHNGKTIEVERITLYDEGVELYKVDRGWLEDEAKSYSVDLYSLEVPNISKAIKTDLSRKDCYYTKGRRTYRHDNAYNLYLNTKTCGITVKTGRTVKSAKSALEQYYNKEVSISGLKATYDNNVPCTEIKTHIHSHIEPLKDAEHKKQILVRLKKCFSQVSIYDVEAFLKEFKEVK
jgi:predicted glutamine amidotransferase